MVCVLQVRQIIGDFAILIAILVCVGIDASVGLPTPKLAVPAEFKVGYSSISSSSSSISGSSRSGGGNGSSSCSRKSEGSG